MKDKKELVYDLAGALVAILFGCIVVIMIIVNIPGTKEIDGALIANVLTGGITLFAPIAGYYLLSNWKDQHNASVYSNFGIEALNKLKKVTYTLASFHDLAFNLSKIDSFTFSSIEKKEEAVTNFLNEYIENRNILMEAKADLLHDIAFIARLNNDINLLSVASKEISKLDEQLYKFNTYIASKKSSKLNKQELLNLLNDDDEVFQQIAVSLTNKIIDILKSYIQA